jgi:hypothetical protein
MVVIFFFIIPQIDAQDKKQYKVGCIAFYNLENIFDTIPGDNDTEFSPNGSNKWDTKKYLKKMENMSTVISQIGDEMFPGGPAILGICEIENRSVVEDLINTPKLKPSSYEIVHYDSPDRRGVDVGLIYRPAFFKVTSSRSATLRVIDDPEFRTRDQLVVTGLFDGEEIHVIVNHWPSRSGGEKRSRPKREAAAGLTRSIVDSILNINPNAKIFVMGDLNDDPINSSVNEVLGAIGDKDKVLSNGLYNPMYNMYKEGVGSLAYQDSWNLFDQIIISKALIGEDKSTFKFYRAKVFKKDFILQQDGQYAGYPFRTFAGGAYAGGYADHLPVYVFIIKEKKYQ